MNAPATSILDKIEAASKERVAAAKVRYQQLVHDIAAGKDFDIEHVEATLAAAGVETDQFRSDLSKKQERFRLADVAAKGVAAEAGLKQALAEVEQCNEEIRKATAKPAVRRELAQQKAEELKVVIEQANAARTRLYNEYRGPAMSRKQEADTRRQTLHLQRLQLQRQLDECKTALSKIGVSGIAVYLTGNTQAADLKAEAAELEAKINQIIAEEESLLALSRELEPEFFKP